MKIQQIWSGPAALGEGPLWHPIEHVLYWVDIAGQQLHRLDIKTHQHRLWDMPALIGCIAPTTNGNLIAGIGDEICYIELPSGKVTPRIKIPDGLRINDGKCDRQGRLWLGTICVEKPIAHLYRFDPDGKLHTMLDGIHVSNGLDWSLDDQTFYYTDSMTHQIFQFDFDADTGQISRRRSFITLPSEQGVPDGLTIDAQGNIWSAHWNGWKVVQYTANGQIAQTINMPVQRPTSCTFGGANLDTLFITSCSIDVGEPIDKTLDLPAGSVFAIRIPEVIGLPANTFGG